MEGTMTKRVTNQKIRETIKMKYLITDDTLANHLIVYGHVQK